MTANIDAALQQNRIDAEVSVLAASLVDQQSALAAVELLSPRSFIHQKHQMVFRAISETIHEGGIPDLIGVARRVAGKVDVSWLSDITTTPLSGQAFVRQWCQQILEHEERRQLFLGIEAITAEARSPLVSTLEVKARLNDLILDFPTTSQAAKPFALVRICEIVTSSPDWLIEGMMTSDTLTLVFSDPGGCKTFLAVSMACSVATGTHFFGRPVKQGPVIFIAGEGFSGLKRRFDAWCIRNQVVIADTPLFVSTAPAALLSPQSVADVIEAIEQITETVGGPPALIVIDTLARNFGPGDENSTSDMSAFIQAADRIRVKYRAAVMLVHHSGHGDKGRARGAMALKGALDFEYRLTRGDDDVIRLESTKCKDFEPPDPMAFKLRSVELPALEGQPPLTGAVLDAVDYEPPPAVKRTNTGRGRNQTKAVEVLKSLIDHHRQNLENDGRDPVGALVTLEEWQLECKIQVGIERNRFKEVRHALENSEVVTVKNGFVSL